MPVVLTWTNVSAPSVTSWSAIVVSGLPYDLPYDLPFPVGSDTIELIWITMTAPATTTWSDA